MSRYLFAIISCFLLAGYAFCQDANTTKKLPEICVNQTEIQLFNLINQYRAQKNLPKIKLSASLCYVARTHAIDQTENFIRGNRCNMHSWSAKGNWSSCCYTPDHKQAKCMWDKPRELTNYKGDGFEIAFWTTYKYTTPEAFAKDVLEGWKKSQGHNDVIINRNVFKNVNWQAIGVGVYGEYADVWFGEEIDSAGEPSSCE